ncbi:hypothetical protein THAOC_18010, partial [Thalassiosira oceanica]
MPTCLHIIIDTNDRPTESLRNPIAAVPTTEDISPNRADEYTGERNCTLFSSAQLSDIWFPATSAACKSADPATRPGGLPSLSLAPLVKHHAQMPRIEAPSLRN